MDTRPGSISPAYLQDRITVAKGQLADLNEDEEEYSVRKMVLEHGLASLEEQLRDAERAESRRQHEENMKWIEDSAVDTGPGAEHKRPHSSYVTQTPGSGFASYAGNSRNAFGGQSTSNEVTAGQGRTTAPASTWGFGSLEDPTATASTTPDTPSFPQVDGRSASNSISSPDSGFLRPQKRQRESVGLSNGAHVAKSMRATPSPAVTGVTTPTSLDSFDIGDNAELARLLGSDPKEDFREMRESQKVHDKLMEDRRLQERLDEEFARSLEAQEDDFDLAGRYSVAGPSIAPRSASQTVFNTQGHSRRPNLLPSSPLAVREDPFSTPSLPIKQETGYRRNGGHVPIKTERSQQALPTRIPSSDFVNLDSDDELEPSNGVAGHPSSDLVEIEPSAFLNTSRYGQAQSSVPGAYDSYGSNAGSSSSANWGIAAGQFGQSLANTANGIYNSAVNLVDQQIASFGNAPMGYGDTSVYGNDYSNFVDLVDYDQQPLEYTQNVFDRHGINPEDPANSALVESYRSRIDYVTHDPTRNAAEIKSLLENIRPDEELPPENREGTPEAMKYNLMEHQKLGLAWMKQMEEGSNKGGILADDMGLGKTIQALALIVTRKSADPLRKTTLIVCPVGLLKQWEREIHKKLKPEHQLKVHILHGPQRDVLWEKLRKFDVVLTTFGTLGTEHKRKEDIEIKKRANPNWRPSGKADLLPLLGDESKWFRVIIDEAQCIKNKGTKAALGAFHLQALTRFCMTGTPMMNSVNELFSLIHFLRIKPYCEGDKFRHDFTRPLKGASETAKRKAMKQLQALLKAILLRRNKKSEIDGKPILDLPERTTNAVHATFSEDELAFYRALETRTQLQFNKFLKAGTVGRNYSNILVLLLRLRQACCHPHLIKDFGQTSGSSEVTPEDMVNLAKELAPDVVNRIKEQCALNDDCALECPVCMDMTDNATIFLPCGHNTCSECFARISDPAQAVVDGTAAEGRADVKCPNCRGKVVPAKVIDTMAFKKVYLPEKIANDLLDADSEADVETTDDSDSESDSEDDDDEDVDAKGNIKGFVVEDDIVEDASDTEDEDDEGYRSGKNPFEKSSSKKRRKPNKGKGKAKADKPPRMTLAQLQKEGRKNLKARKRYSKRLDKEWQTSGKIVETMEILQGLRERRDPKTKEVEKTIIFSQFTSLLDLLEVPINREGYRYRRYDGSMSSNARNDAVLEFSDKEDCTILLVSLKAGNAGLNLIAASQVIILDPFWNPYVEEQAIDRAHRIGQQKPVQVHRILVPNTVEDRILALQEKKREVIEAALDEKASKAVSRLGVQELGFLFDVPT